MRASFYFTHHIDSGTSSILPIYTAAPARYQTHDHVQSCSRHFHAWCEHIDDLHLIPLMVAAMRQSIYRSIQGSDAASQAPVKSNYPGAAAIAAAGSYGLPVTVGCLVPWQ